MHVAPHICGVLRFSMYVEAGMGCTTRMHVSKVSHSMPFRELALFSGSRSGSQMAWRYVLGASYRRAKGRYA